MTNSKLSQNPWLKKFFLDQPLVTKVLIAGAFLSVFFVLYTQFSKDSQAHSLQAREEWQALNAGTDAEDVRIKHLPNTGTLYLDEKVGRVYVDGKEVPKTPAFRSFKPGQYLIKVMMNNRCYYQWTEIKSAQNTIVPLESVEGNAILRL